MEYARSEPRAIGIPRSGVGRVRVANIGMICLLIALALPLLWCSLVAAPRLQVDVGAWGDQTVLAGVNGAESGEGDDFRWTSGATTLTLPNLSSRYQLLQLRAHGWRPEGVAPPLVELRVAGQVWGSFQTTPTRRVYRVLLPRDGWDYDRSVTFNSPVYTPKGDTRNLGFALHDLALVAVGRASGPTFWQFGGQTLLLALAVMLVVRVAPTMKDEGRRTKDEERRTITGQSAYFITLSSCHLVILSLIAALLWANFSEPLWVSEALVHWLIIGVALVLATVFIGPSVQHALVPWLSARQAQIAWALFVGGLALRLLGSAHPFFNAHDVDVHTSWIEIVNRGQLYLYSSPGELHNRAIFNPPGGYVLLMPLGLLLGSPRLIVQVGVALVDALGCLLLLPIARELKLSARAGLMALALAVALPINMTMLWWGFATNALSQTAWLLLLWVVLRQARAPSWRGAAVFAALCALNVLMHIGTIVLIVATLALTLLCALPRLAPRSRWLLIGGALLAALLLAPIYFAPAAEPILAPSGTTLDLGVSLAKGWTDRVLRSSLIWRGLTVGFTVPLLALGAVGVWDVLVAHTRHILQRPLFGVWVCVCAASALAYLSVGLVTRYIYFAAPLVCLAAGVVLARLWCNRAGRVLAFALLALASWTGTYLWVAGVLLRIKPSVVPLTH